MEPIPSDDTGADTGPGPDQRSTARMPRWVKVFLVIAIALVVLVILLLTGVFGGGHGPGRHTPSGATGGLTPSVAHDPWNTGVRQL